MPDNQPEPDAIRTLYESHPYPGAGPMPPAPELANLIKLYGAECELRESGLEFLDVGVGSGNRLLELVRAFPDHSYTAIDFSESALAYARRRFSDEGFPHVRFETANLDSDLSHLGKFDVISCMGVLHHLAEPALAWRNISQLCHDDSIGFFYVYGLYGSGERMRRKRILQILAGTEQDHAWLEWVKRCGFTDLPYGWRNLGDGLPLYLDAYKNPRERLFDIDRILGLLDAGEGCWHAAALQSWISNGKGVLVDADGRRGRLPVATTTLKGLSENPLVLERYAELELLERLRLLEQLYLPEAYTVVAWGKNSFGRLPSDSRLSRSAISLAS